MRRMILVATLGCNAAGGALAQTPAAPPAPSAMTSITGTPPGTDGMMDAPGWGSPRRSR
jgi:hypothetical protein